MSDSDESGVTYMEVSSPFEGLSDIGSPRADDHEYLELPWMLEDPYVEQPSGPTLSRYIVAEDQPYAEDASPTAQSPDYVLDDDKESHQRMIEDDDMDIEADEEEEEEHPAPADSVVVALPAD
ncbi:hypothetical protein Tco_1410242 [Tanacetum coccineum]